MMKTMFQDVDGQVAASAAVSEKQVERQRLRRKLEDIWKWSCFDTVLSFLDLFSSPKQSESLDKARFHLPGAKKPFRVHCRMP